MSSALYRHTLKVYEIMLEQSEVNQYDEQVFRGYLTKVTKGVGASSTYYSSIRGLLLSPIDDPCVEIRARGNSAQPSEIVLRHPPVEELAEVTHTDLTRREQAATMDADLERRVARLEGWRESNFREVSVLETFKDLETRIRRLERKREK